MTAPAWRLRPLVFSDLAAVEKLAAVSFAERWERGSFAYFLTQKDAVNFGAYAGQELVGYFLSLRSDNVLDVISIAVAPTIRRQGLGGQLLDAVLAVPGVTAATLEVAADNAPAIALYESAGFVRVGLRKKYYGGVRDALVLRWDKPRF